MLFLRKIHLFHDLKDDQLSSVAEKFEEVSFDAGKVILAQGTIPDSFYVIFSGKVRVFRVREGNEQELAVMVPGDYFGEMELLSPQGRSANVVAVEPTVLLRLSKAAFEELLSRFSSLKPNLELSIQSRKLARTLRFKWLRPNEVIYFLARKHPILLLQAMVGPVLSLLVPLFLGIWGAVTGSVSAASFAGLLVLAVLGWGVWNAVDWSNDYYIVTNQRVVWMEKVIGIYDSRNEAPLTTILSVGVESDMIGRILDYGTVIVRTFVGAIPFYAVHHPNQAAYMVEEYWQRTKQVSAVEEKDAFKTELRERLGLLPPAREPAPPPRKAASTFSKVYRPSAWRIIGANLFKMRYEEGGTITYRKHWFVLIRKIWVPTLLLLGLVGLLVSRLVQLAADPAQAVMQTLADGTRAVDTTALSLPVLMIPVVGWWLYQYLDWSNDIFRVTSEQILDIDRKPFGTEQRRTAPLDNILSTEYKREGFAGYIFNFGTVYITVGGAQLTFNDVLDPAGVQSDIDTRRMARIASKKQAEMKSERARMAEWIASYHQNVEEIRTEQNLKDRGPKTE